MATAKKTVAKNKKQYKICIDPGHGYPDTGAIGNNGIKEMDVNLSIAKMLKELLEKEDNFKIKLTRDTDKQSSENKAQDLKNRCKIANTFKSDIFISIHCNASADIRANGFEAFTSIGETKADELCDDIYKNIHEMFPELNIRKGNTKYGYGKEANFYVLNNVKAPSIIIETAFLSNIKEEKMLGDIKFDGKVALAIKKAIVNFLDR